MLTSIYRTIIMYAAILISVRLMGKRQISQLQTSELVVTLLISELAVLPIQEHTEPLWNGVVPMLALVACEIVVALFMMKSGRFRKAVCGRPTVVIENGRILQEEVRRLRMSTEDLFEQLRQSNVFYIKDVAFAIIETNGTMSVLKKPECDPLTPKQASVKVKFDGFETAVVSDGQLSENSLHLCGKDAAWVRQQIKKEGLELSDVFIMTARRDGKYQIIRKADPTPKAKG